MADTTQTSDRFMLDREDPETLDASTARQYRLISGLFDLPHFNVLANANQPQVANRIAGFLGNIRGDLRNTVQLTNILNATFNQHLTRVQGVQQGQPVRAALADANVAIAEAWLQTIYEHFGEQELREMIGALPASIRPTSRSGSWGSRNVVLGGAAQNIQIDLQHPIWRIGNQQEIERRLLDRTPAQAGIRAAYNAPLTRDDVNAIFASTAEVVDPLLPTGEITLENIPARGQRTMVNIGSIIRHAPFIARLDAPAMTATFQTNLPAITDNIHIINTANGQNIAYANANAAAVVNGFFDALSRRRNQPFGAREVNLATAVQTRQPIDRLLSGSATNREVLLALATMQRDPAAAAVLENTQNAAEGIRTRMSTNESMLRTAETVNQIRSIDLPSFSRQEIRDGETAMNRIILNARGVVPGTTAVGQQDLLAPPATGAVLNAGQIAQVDNAHIPHALIFNYTPAAPAAGGGVTPASSNIEQFQRVIEQAQQRLTAYHEANNRIDQMENMLQTMISTLEERNIPFITIGNDPNYAALAALIVRRAAPAAGAVPGTLGAPTGFEVQAAAITPRLNRAEIHRQFVRALREANPANRLLLRDVAFYEQEQARLATELAEAEARQTAAGSVGSEACRDVVRRGLEDEGMRGQELEDTVTYMFNSIQRNRESVADLAMYAEREFPDGEDDHDAEHHWEHGKSFRRLATLGLFRSQPYRQYLQSLSQPNNLGFDLTPPDHGDHDHHVDHNFQLRSLPSLLDAHFRLKALTELPESDPHHIPKAEHIVEFQRQLYEAIIDRMQKSLQRSRDATSPEFIEMRARGLNTTDEQFDNMSIGERMQMVRSYLKDSPQYMSDPTNKSNFDRMVSRAYHPVEEAVETHNRWKSYLNPFGAPNRSPITWPKAVLWNAPKAAFNSPVTGVWKKGWRSALVGGAIGFVALPGFGLPIGLVGTPYAMWVVKKFAGEDGAGSAGAHAHDDAHGGGHH